MQYLLVVASLILIIIVVMTCDKDDNSFNALSRGVLRAMSVASFSTSFAVAFGIVDIPTRYYGFIDAQHQLNYAMVFGLGAVTLAILSVFTTKR